MQKQNALTAVVATNDPVFSITYDIRISERQRHYLHLAMKKFIEAGSEYEEDEYGNDVATTLEELLDPNGLAGPLALGCINCFVV